ncbi:MAG: hypothetical protein WA584_09230 [Pyrinomonadaceae bacterium]
MRLLDAGSRKQIGFAGLTINENYIRDEMFSRIVTEIIQSPDASIPHPSILAGAS